MTAGGNTASPLLPPRRFSKRALMVFVGGVALLILGFLLLPLADARGSNWASNVSPLLILSGYFVMAVGLIIKDPSSVLLLR